MRNRLIISAAAGILIAGGGWWVSHRPTAPSAPAPPPVSAAHEQAFLEEQLRRKPGHAPILLRLGEIEHAAGKLSDARRHLERAVAADGSLVDAHLELTLVCYEMGDTEAAERQSRSILERDPRQPDALYNLGAICANRGDVRRAREYWNDAVRYGAGTPGGNKAAAALSQLLPTNTH